jgi:hypothetical protein
MKHPIKAERIVHGVKTEYDQFDCRILNKIAKLVIHYGAISFERLQGITQYQARTIHWAMWHLEAIETPAQLWILPG